MKLTVLNVIGIALLALIVLVSASIGTSVVMNQNGSGVVTNSTQYNAGRIQDNETYNVLGYNLIISYKGATTQVQVLCPLYPVGSVIPIFWYIDFLWIWPGLSVGSNLPQGCQTNGGN